MTPERTAAIVVAFLGTTIFYWVYFDEVADRAAERLARAGPDRGRLARDAFTYLHIPIVAGMLVTAVGDELMIAHPLEPLHGDALLVLATGTIAYAVLAVVATLDTRTRLWGRPGGGRTARLARAQISPEAFRPSRRRRSRTSEPRARTRD